MLLNNLVNFLHLGSLHTHASLWVEPGMKNDPGDDEEEPDGGVKKGSDADMINVEDTKFVAADASCAPCL